MDQDIDTYLNNIGNATVKKNDYLLAQKYNPDRFNPKELLEITGGVIAIISPTGLGKTVLLTDILKNIHKKYDRILMMSPTAKFQKCYDYFPRGSLVDDFDEDMLVDIWQTQEKRYEQDLKLDSVLIIMDDIIHNPAFKKSAEMKRFATSARHLNITIILLSQDFNSIVPIIRKNIRAVFAFYLDIELERLKFVEYFLSLHNKRVSELVYRKLTSIKYQCIVILLHKGMVPFQEKVKIYIADPKACDKIVMEDEVKEKQKSRKVFLYK